jgi:hypothetical protein
MSRNAAIAEFKVAAPYLQPLIIPAFAFAFNIGYFSAIDIGWFTFFDLSEHIVFALKALPIAIGASIGFEIGLRFHLIERHFHLHKHFGRYVYYTWLVTLCFAVVASSLHGRLGLCLSFVAVLAGAVIHHKLRAPRRSLIDVLYWASTLLFATILVGYFSAYAIPYQRYSRLSMRQQYDLVGNIVFSGNKYLLIYEPGQTDQAACLNFLRDQKFSSDHEDHIRIVLWSDVGGVTLCPREWWGPIG